MYELFYWTTYMSYSSLMLLTPDTALGSIEAYQNSWLFAPVSWDIQLNSYIPDEIKTDYGIAKSLIGGPNAEELFRLTNKAINNSLCTSDRIVWELSHQQIFFTKDKELVANSILEYYENHKNDTLLYDKENPLQEDHIKNRWEEIAQDIMHIDTDKFKYFVLKCTSVDDGVERWFKYYDEEQDEPFKSTLKDYLTRKDSDIVELVNIEDGKITGFTSSRMDTFEL